MRKAAVIDILNCVNGYKALDDANEQNVSNFITMTKNRTWQIMRLQTNSSVKYASIFGKRKAE